MKQINSSKISIPKKLFNSDTQIAYDTIFDYFNGFDVEIEETSLYYNLFLQKSDFAYCEDITIGLRQLGITPDMICDYCYIDSNSCICLSENWLPYGWRVISGQNLVTNKTAIIHIDDHSDLMKPFISFESGKFINILSNYADTSLSADFLKNAIETGAITIGSMLTVILFSLQNFNIYHLKQNVENKRMGIIKHYSSDSILPKYNRIGIDYKNDYVGTTYYLTSSIKDIILNLQEEEQCILHIDMDFFNNRYNGSTSWMLDGREKDYPLKEQKQKMIEIASALKTINNTIPIKYVLIGLSPSFYPAEYWKEGLCFLLKELDNSGINVKALLKKYG